MIPIAGGIGIGALWGWLVGGRNNLLFKRVHSVLFMVIVSSFLAGEVFFYADWQGLMVYILSLGIFAVLHHAWRLFLLERSVNRGGKEGLEV